MFWIAVVSSDWLISPSPLVSICEKAFSSAVVSAELEVDEDELEEDELVLELGSPRAFSISLRLRLPSPFESYCEISELACPDAEFSCAEISADSVSWEKASAGDCRVEIVEDVPAPPVTVLELSLEDDEVCPAAEVAEVDDAPPLNIDSICDMSC